MVVRFLAPCGLIIFALNTFVDYKNFGWDIEIFFARLFPTLFLSMLFILTYTKASIKTLNWVIFLTCAVTFQATFYIDVRNFTFTRGLEITMYTMVLPLFWWNTLSVWLMHIGYFLAAIIFSQIFSETHADAINSSFISKSVSLSLIYFVIYAYKKNIANLLDRQLILTKNLQSAQNQIIHDVKSPLMALKHYTSKNSDQNKLLNMATERVEQIISDLIDNSNFEKPNHNVFDVVETTKYLLKEKPKVPFTFNVNLPANQHQIAMKGVNKALYSRIVSNIINNAVESTEDECPPVDITLYLKLNDLIVEVKDRGPGIPEDQVPSVLQKGFTTKSSGSGLGLAHAYETLMSRGGKVHLENIEKGFIVRLNFPLKN